MAADFAVLCEPTDGVVEGGCQGSLHVEVITRGKRSHSARSWWGHNAIHDQAEVLRRLSVYVPREPVVDGLAFHEGLNATGISGGVAGNVIPDECRVGVNYRFAPDRTEAEALAHLEEVFEGYELELHDSAPARPARTRPAGGSGVRVGDRRDATSEVRLDRRRPVRRTRNPGGELRPRRPGPRALGR